MLSANSKENLQSRIISTLDEQKESYQKILEGRPLEAEDNNERKLAFIHKQMAVSDDVATRIANYEDPENLPVSDDVKKKAELITEDL